VSPIRFAGLALVGVLAAGCATSTSTPAPMQRSEASSRPVDAKALFDGVWYWRAAPLGDEPQAVHVMEVDLRRPGVSLMITPGAPEGGREYVAMTPSVFVARFGLQAAINGGYFLPFKGGTQGQDDYIPQAGDPAFVSGMAMHAGKVVSPVETDPADKDNYDIRITTAFCVLKDRIRIENGQVCPAGVREALSAGPRLLAAGEEVEIVPSFSPAPTPPPPPPAPSPPPPVDPNASAPTAPTAPAAPARPRGAPRTAVGIDATGTRLWMVVVDGRQPGYSTGASNAQLKALFKSLGAYDAMSFDGGGSSTMVAAGLAGAPRLLSRPIHTGVPGRERPSANHLGVRANPVPR
jgi:hypothetical protein